MPTKLNSRKLWASIVLYLTATVALFFNKTDFQQFSTFMIFVYGIYSGGNILDKTVGNSDENKTVNTSTTSKEINITSTGGN